MYDTGDFPTRRYLPAGAGKVEVGALRIVIRPANNRAIKDVVFGRALGTLE